MEPWMIAIGVNGILAAMAWGDLRRQVTFNRDLQDERHNENKATLHEIAADLKRINGTVREHSVRLDRIDQ